MILDKDFQLLTKASFTRMSGDDPSTRPPSSFPSEFYPHERGWSFDRIYQGAVDLVLPAWAGMILDIAYHFQACLGFTRMSGDDPSR